MVFFQLYKDREKMKNSSIVLSFSKCWHVFTQILCKIYIRPTHLNCMIVNSLCVMFLQDNITVSFCWRTFTTVPDLSFSLFIDCGTKRKAPSALMHLR